MRERELAVASASSSSSSLLQLRAEVAGREEDWARERQQREEEGATREQQVKVRGEGGVGRCVIYQALRFLRFRVSRSRKTKNIQQKNPAYGRHQLS